MFYNTCHAICAALISNIWSLTQKDYVEPIFHSSSPLMIFYIKQSSDHYTTRGACYIDDRSGQNSTYMMVNAPLTMCWLSSLIMIVNMEE